MKKLHAWVILVVLLSLIWGGAVYAAQLLFTPRATVTEEYNDNIDLDRRNKQDDFITTVTVGGTLELLGQVSGMRVSYDPGYSFYADNDQFDSWEHNLLGSVWHNFSRETRLDLTNYFLYTKDPLADDVVEDERGNIIVRGNDRQRNPPGRQPAQARELLAPPDPARERGRIHARHGAREPTAPRDTPRVGRLALRARRVRDDRADHRCLQTRAPRRQAPAPRDRWRRDDVHRADDRLRQ